MIRGRPVVPLVARAVLALAQDRPVEAVGPRARMIAVFSYYETPGVAFSAEERLGFYGRAGAHAGPSRQGDSSG